MRKSQGSQLITYSLVAILCVGASFAISLKFISKTRAQEGGEAEAAAAAAAAHSPAPPANAKFAPPPKAPQVNGAATPAPPAPAPGSPATAAPVAASPKSGGGTELSALEGFLEPFIYDVVNRRDPFLAYAEYVAIDTAAAARPLSPAQRFELDQLRLVGIMWDIRDPKAMFMDPEAEVIVLGRDEGIGNHNGYIASIREGEVVVVEAIRKRGDIIYKTRVLRIER